jgi:hypothetical protein
MMCAGLSYVVVQWAAALAAPAQAALSGAALHFVCVAVVVFGPFCHAGAFQAAGRGGASLESCMCASREFGAGGFVWVCLRRLLLDRCR